MLGDSLFFQTHIQRSNDLKTIILVLGALQNSEISAKEETDQIALLSFARDHGAVKGASLHSWAQARQSERAWGAPLWSNAKPLETEVCHGSSGRPSP